MLITNLGKQSSFSPSVFLFFNVFVLLHWQFLFSLYVISCLFFSEAENHLGDLEKYSEFPGDFLLSSNDKRRIDSKKKWQVNWHFNTKLLLVL